MTYGPDMVFDLATGVKLREEHPLDSEPWLVGQGPVTFSTSLEMVAPWRMVWDTNGYYSELGVKSSASRREIREAYQAKEGWKSTRLTYILKQLLDPQIRATYDQTPFGSFFWDDYMTDQMRRDRIREMIGLRQDGLAREAEFLADMPLDWDPENLSQRPPSVSKDGYDAFAWSFYQWGTYCEDRARLRQWQRLLIEALGERKEHHEIAIGFCGSQGPWGVRTVGYRVVVFLSDSEQPTEALARAAASRVVEHNDIRRDIK